jgi:hypothetical protein
VLRSYFSVGVVVLVVRRTCRVLLASVRVQKRYRRLRHPGILTDMLFSAHFIYRSWRSRSR